MGPAMRELAQWVKGCHWQENKWDVQSVRPQGCDDSSACFRSSENRAFLPGNAALCTHGNAVGICPAHSWIPLAKINRVVPEAFPSWCGISNTGSYCVLGHCHEAALCPAVPIACWNPGALKVGLLPEVAVQSGLFHGGSYRCCPTSPSSCRKQKKAKKCWGFICSTMRIITPKLLPSVSQLNFTTYVPYKYGVHWGEHMNSVSFLWAVMWQLSHVPSEK